MLYAAAVITAIIAHFILTVAACSFALGRMHVWLKGRAEVFGDNEGLREELADIRGHCIEARNAPILNRHNITPS